MVAACVSFGGLCVMCQNIPQIKKCGMKISEYLLFRIINSILSFYVCRLLLQIYWEVDGAPSVSYEWYERAD